VLNRRKRILSATKSSGGGPTYQQKILADGAIYYWPLDDTAGPVIDKVGAVNGTIVGTVQRGVTGPGADKVMSFAGAGSVSLPVITIPAISTVELWVKTSSLIQYNVLFTNRTAAQSTNYLFMIQDGSFIFSCTGAGLNSTTSNYNNGAWHHIVLTANGPTMVLYKDKVTDATNMTGTVGATSAVGKICNDDFSPGGVAAIGDIAIYPRVLSPAEVQAHFALR